MAEAELGEKMESLDVCKPTTETMETLEFC